MSTSEMIDEIDNILWHNNSLPYNGELYLKDLGVTDFPIVFDCRVLVVKVIALKRNCRAYLSIEKLRGTDDGTMAMLTDLPPKTIKELYSIMKKHKPKKVS